MTTPSDRRKLTAKLLNIALQLLRDDPELMALAEVLASKEYKAAEEDRAQDAKLRPVHWAILARLTREGQSRKKLIRQTTYPDTGYTRMALHYLCQHGYARKIRGNLYVRGERQPTCDYEVLDYRPNAGPRVHSNGHVPH
jgi:hypothetical protein